MTIFGKLGFMRPNPMTLKSWKRECHVIDSISPYILKNVSQFYISLAGCETQAGSHFFTSCGIKFFKECIVQWKAGELSIANKIENWYIIYSWIILKAVILIEFQVTKYFEWSNPNKGEAFFSLGCKVYF